jgi:biotin-(acetyl-CoA carboxylase) ligase
MPLAKPSTPAKHSTLDLPPGFTEVKLRELGDAYAHACAIAQAQGAGALVWVGRYDLVEFAVVLEPDEPLAGARRAHFAAMNAIGDAIAAHCPPERDVAFAWPDTVLFDGALIGGLRLAWPQDCAEDQIPDWLVVGVMLRAADLSHVDTGLVPGSTSLLSEGFEMLDCEAIIASFTRHLMTHFDRWKEKGFKAVAQDFFARLPPGKAGERRAIDGDGDLLVHAPLDTGPARRSSLVEALKQAAWLDAQHGAPRLR